MSSPPDDDVLAAAIPEMPASAHIDRRLSSIDSEARRLWVTKILHRKIGPFQVLEVLGEDESGVYFKAFEAGKNRLVRLKVLWLKIAQDDTAFARFVRAMRTTIDFDHPNLVRLNAAGRDGEYCYMASEFVEAVPLSQAVRSKGTSGRLDWRVVLRIAKDVCNGLEFVFEKQILHRNIKPNNILITAEGVAKIDNLILAKAIEGAQGEQISSIGTEELVGELGYMAPELISRDEEPDWRSDIYSLGVTLYWALAGRLPFHSKSVAELRRLIETTDPDPPQNYQPALPDAFQQIVLRMLAKDPDDRYTTPAHILRDLRKIEVPA